MMVTDYYVNCKEVNDILAPPGEISLITGVGHGHPRGWNREKPKKNAWARKHKQAKMKKASRKRNRR